MTLDLSTYERGYYGYMNQEVRDALGELQDTGAVRAVLTLRRSYHLSKSLRPETWP
jgi:hypothetical protein